MKEQVLLSYTKGIRNTPSDMLSEDGELAECVNLEVKGNELTPVEMPSNLLFTMEDSEVLILVHNLPSGGKNYASLTNGVIRFFNAVLNTKNYISDSYTIGELKSIQAIGNTVVVYTENAPHYFLFSESRYKYLGSNIPEINIGVNLVGDVDYTDKVYVETQDSYDGNLDGLSKLTEEQSDEITPQVIAEVNKFINQKTVEGYFLFPFFIRYAYRMYDGSHIMHSAPILMLPSTKIAPACLITEVEGNRIYYVVASYAAKPVIVVNGSTSGLSDWSDIIKGVDFFVTKQIYTYDQEGDVSGVEMYYSTTLELDTFSSEFCGTKGRSSKSYERYGLFKRLLDIYPQVTTTCAWILPSKPYGDVTNEITSSSIFYLYKSLSLESLSSSYIEFGTENESVSNIETGTRLKDDYMTHDVLLPKFSFLYNSRLNISNIQRKLFAGYPAESMMQYTSGGSWYDVYTYIHNSSGSDIVVKSEGSTWITMTGSYLFYPDSDAYKMVIVDRTLGRYVTVDLIEHPLLNGAYWFSSFSQLSFISGTPSVSVTADNVEYLPNTLMLSEVNNPFYFPLEGIYTVGSSNIIGMATVTRPISQGQFGEYPMIAFCSDGNYALRVDEQGYYSGISPIQEDVVLGADKVVSMENSVAIITQKGIMLTSGNDMTPLTEKIKGGVFDTSVLAGLAEGPDEITLLVNHSKDTYGFIDYLRGSRMAFDYASNRILIYNPEHTYAYFYSFESSAVTKIVLPNGSKFITSVIDYPDTLLQDAAGNLYSLYHKEDVNILTDEVYGFALTRPLKLGKALALKSIMEVKNIEEASSANGYVKYRLYGTNDNRRYYHVKSRYGKPYKYYRLAIYTKLLPKDAFVGTALTVDYRRTHKFR